MKNVAAPTFRETLSGSTHTSFLHQIQNGSEKAWYEFYRRYEGMIRLIGMQRELTPEECDDLMVEVMVIFWKKLDQFLSAPERGRFRDYLCSVTDLVAAKLFRRLHSEKLPPVTTEELLVYPEDIDAEYMAEWQEFILSKALEDLKLQVDTQTYQVFYMLVIQKRPVDEVMAVTRKSSNNIYVIRSRCMKKLKMLVRAYRECEELELFFHSHRNMQN